MARVGDWTIDITLRSSLFQQPHANKEEDLKVAPLPVQPSLRPVSSTISQYCLKVEDLI